nr:hypothetical protein [uncultured Cellulosilyticum sp.]
MKFIALNLLLTLVVVILCWKDKTKAIFLGCIGALMPGVGLLFVIGYYLIDKLLGNKVGKVAYLEEAPDVSHRQVESLEKVERIVAVSEALALNDTKIKKEVLIGMLREDKTKYIEPLKVALQDEDTEASHYAAVALMEIKDDFHKAIEKIGAKLKEAPNDLNVLEEYAAVLEVSIQSGLNDEKRLSYLEATYAKVLERLIHEGRTTARYYEEKIKCEMRRGEFEKAYTYCTAFKEAYEETEEPYLCLMHYYYVTKNHDSFKEVMEELRYSAVTLSREGLQNMRFWLGGMA